MPGLDVAFDERVEVTLRGTTLRGENVDRTVPVCGPGAFTILKALAFDGRGAPKDAYDLLYVLRGWPAGAADVADRLVTHAEYHPDIVEKALRILARDFADPDMIGPRRVVEFDGALVDDPDAAGADAHGFVDDLLRACRERGLAYK